MVAQTGSRTHRTFSPQGKPKDTKTMTTPNTEMTQAEPRSTVVIGKTGIQLTTLDEMWRFAVAVAKSGLAPKGIQTPEAITVAIQMGLEVGLTPMAALQNIAVINGRPSLWGDAQLAVVRATGELEEFKEWYEEDGNPLTRNPASYKDSTSCVCRVKRRGYDATETSFSVADAKLAKLWGKQGPWTEYPGRMLKFRARSFALRDMFGDALRGMSSAEEQMDMPKERQATGRVVADTAVDPYAEVSPSPVALKALADFASGTEEPVAPVAEQYPEESPFVSEADERASLISDIKATCADQNVAFNQFGQVCKNAGHVSGTGTLRDVTIESLRTIHDDRLAILRNALGKDGEA